MMTSRLHCAVASLFAVSVLAACRPQPSMLPSSTPTNDILVPASPQTGATGGSTEIPTLDATPVAAAKEISVYLGNSAQTLDPVMLAPQDAAAHDLIANLFTGIAYLDPDTGLVEPALAQTWERSADGLTWTVYLRDDVSWVRVNAETGQQERVRPIRSVDVVRALRRACRSEPRAPLAASLFVIEGCRELFSLPPEQVTAEKVEQLLGARVLNDTVLEFQLTEDTAVFLTLMATPALYPVPADLIDSAGEGWTDPAVLWTSGPYTIDPSSSAENGYKLIANEYWPFTRSGNVDAVHVVSSTANNAFDAWSRGELAASVVPPGQLQNINFGWDSGYQLQALPAMTMLAFSYDTPPMERPGVRQALSLAVDRQALIDEVLEQNGVAALPAQALTPPGMAAAPPYGTVGSGYDPQAAQAALISAGYPGCITMPPLTLLVDDSDVSRTLGARIAEMWRSTLGCNESQIIVEERTLREVLIFSHEPPTEIQRQFRPLRAQAILLSWQADYPDAHHWLSDIVGCREMFVRSYLNSARGCVESDRLMAQAQTTHDQSARVNLYAQIEEALFSVQGEVPAAPLLIYARPLAFQQGIEFAPRQAGPLRFDRWIVNTQ